MKAHLTRRYRFSASHRLHSNEMPEAWNRDTYGKCNNPYGHGHNYHLEVTLSGPVEILDRFGHQNLNTLPEFADEVPTTENLCVTIYDILQRGFRLAHLEKVRMEETMMNSFEYAGGAEVRV
jgi:6-pyruvoyltetrahydropterin/6-carboxytetrahydropterin synthase